jgi:hypothetical protein
MERYEKEVAVGNTECSEVQIAHFSPSSWSVNCQFLRSTSGQHSASSKPVQEEI